MHSSAPQAPKKNTENTQISKLSNSIMKKYLRNRIQVYSRKNFQIQVYSSILEGISLFKYIQVFSRTLRTLILQFLRWDTKQTLVLVYVGFIFINFNIVDSVHKSQHTMPIDSLCKQLGKFKIHIFACELLVDSRVCVQLKKIRN